MLIKEADAKFLGDWSALVTQGILIPLLRAAVATALGLLYLCSVCWQGSCTAHTSYVQWLKDRRTK